MRDRPLPSYSVLIWSPALGSVQSADLSVFEKWGDTSPLESFMRAGKRALELTAPETPVQPRAPHPIAMPFCVLRGRSDRAAFLLADQREDIRNTWLDPRKGKKKSKVL